MFKLILLTLLVVSVSFIPLSFSEEIPDWVKNTAGWWSERKISQSEFIIGIEFLINEGIIYVPPTEPGLPGPDKILPDWIRNTAGWWSKNLIPDSEFVNAMKYLIEIGIMEVEVSTPEILDEIIEESETPILVGTPLNMILDGYLFAAADGKFVLDIKVLDANIYSGTSFGGTPRSANLDGVNIDISLYNEDGLIHTFNAQTENGFVRYVVMAKETNQNVAAWLANNMYTVKIVATLDDQSVEKNYEFYGQSSGYAYNAGSTPDTSDYAYDVSNASYSGNSILVNPPAAKPEGLIFTPDGSKMFVSDDTGTQIEEFRLTTPWLITSAVDSESPLNITFSGASDIEDIAFNADGTKLFVVDRAQDKILEYTVSPAYDISEAAIVSSGDLDMTSDSVDNAEDLFFSTDGLTLFVLDNQDDDEIVAFTCSLSFDASECDTVKNRLTLVDGSGSNLNASDAFEFSSDGTTLFIADPGADVIQQYSLLNWDITSASHVKTFDISSQEGASRGLAFNDDGTKFYLVGNDNKTVFEYHLSG